LKPKAADLILEKALEAEVQLDLAVGEQHKRRRATAAWSCRRCACAWTAARGALEVDLVQEAVHLASGDALAPFGGHGDHLMQHAQQLVAAGSVASSAEIKTTTRSSGT